MDPTKCLAEIRELIAHDDPAEVAEPIVERFDALDGWMSKGGFLPRQWNHSGRPVSTEPGVVLDNVTHGTVSGYNAGCHCLDCRAANREKARRYRMNKKEK